MSDEAADLDSIANSVNESTNTEIPMESDHPAETPQPTPQEYAFKYNGQDIKAPIDKILRWAEQGYGAPQKIGELAQKLKGYEDRFKGYEQYDKTYKPIDEWARQNPDKWKALFDGWQQAQFGQIPNGQNQQAQPPQLPPELIQKINQFDQKFQAQEQREVLQRNQAADKSLDGDIQSIRKSYPNLDFDAPDERGNTLEYRILEHATKNGIPSFRAAFRDYCFDQLNSMSKTQGREAAGMSPKTRDALTGKNSSARGQGPSVENLIKGRNYDQIHELVLQEMGLSG